MTFDLDQRQQAWQTSARTLTLPDAAPAPAEQVVRRAADAGLTDPGADLLAVLVAAEALAGRSAAAGAA
ncbi:MAG: hypothetical protein FJW23_17415, partial [Acidimicrobiia bacterium]|nr:hypothetical protein [Acidimicrobiia bacterium]